MDRTHGFIQRHHTHTHTHTHTHIQGTGHTTWDGAVLLAKYLEHAYGGDGKMRGKRVLETGAGA